MDEFFAKVVKKKNMRSIVNQASVLAIILTVNSDAGQIAFEADSACLQASQKVTRAYADL